MQRLVVLCDEKLQSTDNNLSGFLIRKIFENFPIKEKVLDILLHQPSDSENNQIFRIREDNPDRNDNFLLEESYA